MKVTLGKTNIKGKEYKYVFNWIDKNFESLVIAGVSGQGKSHTVAVLLTQMVYHGADLLIADYSESANNATGETIIERLAHVDKSIVQVARTRKEIEAMVDYIIDIRDKRKNGNLPLTPIIVCFDEFIQFCISDPKLKELKSKKDKVVDGEGFETKVTKKSKTVYEKLMALLVDCRKYNIVVWFIGQDWSTKTSTSEVRAIRDNVQTVILHKVSETNANMLGVTDKAKQRVISNLRKGTVYIDDCIVRVPYPLSENVVEMVRDELAKRPDRLL